MNGHERITGIRAIVARSAGEYDRTLALLEANLSTFRGLDHADGTWWTLDQPDEPSAVWGILRAHVECLRNVSP